MAYDKTSPRAAFAARVVQDRRLSLILKASLYIFASLSLIYTVITAPSQGHDLRYFQLMAQAWVDGIYQNNMVYPPYAVVLFSPLSLLTHDQLRIAWIGVNLAATGLCIYLATEIWGREWPSNARFLLAALLLSFAPFRVAIRQGQTSLIITALLLGTLLARDRKRDLLAGVLLGLALCKYSLSFAFFLYFAFRMEWRIIATALTVPAVLTQVYAYRLGQSALETGSNYVNWIITNLITDRADLIGVTEIKPLLIDLTGGNEPLASVLSLCLMALAIISMAFIFRRRPRCESIHFAAIAFFTLWSVYHRVYDAVLCILPAAILIDFIIRKRFINFSLIGLGSLSLLVISLPGLLTERLRISEESLSSNLAGLVGLHIERILMFVLFWAFLFLIWRTHSPSSEPEDAPGEMGRACG